MTGYMNKMEDCGGEKGLAEINSEQEYCIVTNGETLAHLYFNEKELNVKK